MTTTTQIQEQGLHLLPENRKEGAEVSIYASIECPYASRSWFALEESGIQYNLISYDLRKPGTMEHKENQKPSWFYETLPILIHHTKEGDKTLNESLVINEYIAENFCQRLVPADLHQRALMRIWTLFYCYHIETGFYNLLIAQTVEQQVEAGKKLKEAIRYFAEKGLPQMRDAYFKKAESPALPDEKLFLMGDQIALLDIFTAPFFNRFNTVLKHYRGFDIFAEADSNEHVKKLQKWFTNIIARPSYQRITRQVKTIPIELEVMKHLDIKERESFNFDKVMLASEFSTANPGAKFDKGKL